VDNLSEKNTNSNNKIPNSNRKGVRKNKENLSFISRIKFSPYYIQSTPYPNTEGCKGRYPSPGGRNGRFYHTMEGCKDEN